MKKNVFVLQILGVLGVVLILVKLNLFGVGNVILENPDNGCVSEEVIKKDPNLIQKNLFLIDKKQILNNLISRYSCLKDMEIKYSFPKKLKINIRVRDPIAKINSYNTQTPKTLNDLSLEEASSAALLDWNFPGDNSDESLVVDDSGYIFKKMNDEPLPTLFVKGDALKLGQRLDEPTFNKISKIFEKIKNMEISFQKAKLDDETLLIESNPKVTFSLSGDTFRQLASLQLILQEAKINGKVIQIIDLRFDKPVVAYTSKKNG